MPINLGLDGDVTVAPPVLPSITVAPPNPTSVTVLPVAGPPGPPGDVIGQVRLLGVAGDILSGHRVVTPNTDSTLRYASNDNPDDVAAPLWLTLGAAVVGAPVDVLTFGAVAEPSWSWTPGPLYLGVDGQLTQNPPSGPAALFLTQVGYATAATSAFIDSHLPISLTP